MAVFRSVVVVLLFPAAQGYDQGACADQEQGGEDHAPFPARAHWSSPDPSPEPPDWTG